MLRLWSAVQPIHSRTAEPTPCRATGPAAGTWNLCGLAAALLWRLMLGYTRHLMGSTCGVERNGTGQRGEATCGRREEAWGAESLRPNPLSDTEISNYAICGLYSILRHTLCPRFESMRSSSDPVSVYVEPVAWHYRFRTMHTPPVHCTVLCHYVMYEISHESRQFSAT
jgi:hypothetical protein